MKNFAKLLNDLFYTYSHHTKTDILKNYFSTTEDPERGYAIAIISGSLSFPTFKRGVVLELIKEQIDPYLFALSYDYVGDLSETVSLLWKSNNLTDNLPPLSEIIHQLTTLPKSNIKDYLRELLNQCNTTERWALLKLGGNSLRIGVSARFLKQALAQYGNQTIETIEQIWHSLKPPYLTLFAWLEGKIPQPDLNGSIYFHPVMLAHPLDDKTLKLISPELFVIERKYDGIRVQFIHTNKDKALFSRTGEDINLAFPDLFEINLKSSVVLDGELVIKTQNGIASFNQLQQRLNRKTASKKLLEDSPAHIILYDILMLNNQDLRALTFTERRELLEEWFEFVNPERMSLSELLTFNCSSELPQVKENILLTNETSVEGLMIKRKASSYIAGRPSGQWYKWKRDPYVVDAILMYAQRGHGKRSSFYSDYTFGLWRDNNLLPIGKAYFGFTDEELKQLDKWVRNHTINRFGPVREVEKSLVLEIAFEAVSLSKRHKSGFALRFPRINRIRWDKPANEADNLTILNNYL